MLRYAIGRASSSCELQVFNPRENYDEKDITKNSGGPNKTCHNLFKVDAKSNIASDRRYLQLVTIAMKIGFLRLTTVVNYAMPHNGIRADFPLKSWMVVVCVLSVRQRH